MGNRTPDFPEYPEWSTARFFSFIRSGLRAKWMRWPEKWNVLKEARRDVAKSKGVRYRFEYLCDQCKDWFPQKGVEVDHVVACGTLKCYDDIGPFVEKLFVSKDKLRVVCRQCHKELTKIERERIKENKND